MAPTWPHMGNTALRRETQPCMGNHSPLKQEKLRMLDLLQAEKLEPSALLQII